MAEHQLARTSLTRDHATIFAFQRRDTVTGLERLVAELYSQESLVKRAIPELTRTPLDQMEHCSEK